MTTGGCSTIGSGYPFPSLVVPPEPEIWVVYCRDDYDEPDCLAIYTSELEALRYANKNHYGTVVKMEPGDFADQIRAIWAREAEEWEAKRQENLKKGGQ